MVKATQNLSHPCRRGADQERGIFRTLTAGPARRAGATHMSATTPAAIAVVPPPATPHPRQFDVPW